jgi:hypothetical protein
MDSITRSRVYASTSYMGGISILVSTPDTSPNPHPNSQESLFSHLKPQSKHLTVVDHPTAIAHQFRATANPLTAT